MTAASVPQLPVIHNDICCSRRVVLEIRKEGSMEAVAIGKRKKGLWGRVGFWLTNIVILVLAALFITRCSAYMIAVKGRSMEPTVAQGSSVFVNRASYALSAPKRYDVIAFKTADGDELVKRIIGLPGETVHIVDGTIYINGTALTAASAYIGEISTAGQAASNILLGEDEYFVLGDNPSYSEDSRFSDVGAVKRSSIIGKAWFCFSSILDFKLL